MLCIVVAKHQRNMHYVIVQGSDTHSSLAAIAEIGACYVPKVYVAVKRARP